MNEGNNNNNFNIGNESTYFSERSEPFMGNINSNQNINNNKNKYK